MAALHFAAIFGSFVAGNVLSGFLIQDSTLQICRRYGVALLLALAVPLLTRQDIFGIYAASCACGLQNAMVSTYSGAVIRTTHVSGMFTDLGIFLGHRLRGLPVDSRRLSLCVLVISGFLCGGVAGAVAFHHFGSPRATPGSSPSSSAIAGRGRVSAPGCSICWWKMDAPKGLDAIIAGVLPENGDMQHPFRKAGFTQQYELGDPDVLAELILRPSASAASRPQNEGAARRGNAGSPAPRRP